MKKIKILSILLLAVLTLPVLTSCGNDDEDNSVNEYAGVWKCTSPATYVKSTLVTKGTTLHITSSGNMTWTISTGKRYDATRLGYSQGFIVGDEDTASCQGCYWYDPQYFNKIISKDYKKEK